MFRSKKRASHQPLAPATPSSSAALAASSAFVKNANSNASLSSAAAAAALRSHTPPPTNPGDLTTKRMIRRGSTSSQGSVSGTRGVSPARPGLQRYNSNGSMTDRSFRSPSPGRPGTANGTRGADLYAPPVPAIPQSMNAQSAPHKRASSMEPQMRIASPPPTRPGGRGMSVDAGARQQQRVSSLSSLNTNQASPSNNANRNSVNFSRPMSPPVSPDATSPTSKQGRSGWFTAPVISSAEPRQTAHDQYKIQTGAGAVNAYGVQQDIVNAANAPVRTKQAQPTAGNFKPTMVFDPASRTMKPVSQVHPPVPHRDEMEPPKVSTNLAARTQQGVSPTTDRPQVYQSRASGLSKQPSIVRERREEEEEAEATSPRYTRVTSPVPRVTSPTPIQTRQPGDMPQSPPRQYHTRTASLQREAVTKAREASLSPGRSAHFSAAPMIFLQDGIRHEPPPRSLSPAKPALKQSPASSVRAESPVANFSQSPSYRPPPSDASVSGSDDGTMARRRKSVRVSFGDEPPQVIPEVASPKPAVPVYDDENFEMSPRPVLPSFGSVRSRTRQSPAMSPEPAVKVTETVPSTSTSAHGSADSSGAPPRLESSSDLALGSMISADLMAREAYLAAESDERTPHGLDANAPVPPEVTTVEGSGYISDGSDFGEDISAPPVPTAPTVVTHPTRDEENSLAMSGATLVPDEAERKLASEPPGPIAATVQSPAEVPSIAEVPKLAVQPPTPAAVEEKEPEDWQLKMPGGATGIWDDTPEPSREPTPANVTSAAPPPVAQEAASTTSIPALAAVPAPADAPAPILTATPAPAIGNLAFEESDNDSIYSDAEEDLSDREEGFASLNAIIESPLASTADSPVTARGALFGTSPLTQPTPQTRESATADWTESTAYWSRLSEQRKAELERQARGEVYVEEPTPTPAPRAAQQQPAARRKKEVSAAGVAAGAAAPILAAEARQQKQPKPLRSSMRQSQPQSVPQPQPQGGEVRMRRSMRGSGGQDSNEPDVHHFRSSMRSGGGPAHARTGSGSSLPTSLRTGGGMQQSRFASPPPADPRGALQKRALPATTPSAPRPSQQPRTASGGRLSAAAPIPAAYTMPALARRGSGDSDSSFKRQRKGGSVMSEGGFSMRKSMRGASEPPRRELAPPAQITTAPLTAPASQRAMAKTMRQQSPARPATATDAPPGKARRFSLRSLSPSGSLLGGRKKMRGSIDERATPASPTRSRFQSSDVRAQPAGFQQSRQQAPIPAPTMRARADPKPKASGGFKSRFANDSDDEDSPVQRRAFKSRFADSDDEDEPTKLTPVRGIPRKPGAEDGDSTDLEEESEVGELPSRMVNGAQAQGSALAAGSMRDKTGTGGLADSKHAPPTPSLPTSPVGTPRKEKRSFFSIRKPKRASSVPPQSKPAIDTTQPLPINNITQRSPQSPGSRPGSRPQSPKLQRRRTPQSLSRIGSDSWPLTPPPMQTRPGADFFTRQDSAPGGLTRPGADFFARQDSERPGTANTEDVLGSSPMAARPDINRRTTVDGVNGIGGSRSGLRFDEANVESTGGGEPKAGIYSARTGKKKKFPMLRKAFGLND